MKGNVTKPAVVYEAVNLVNGKRYIGITGRGILARSAEHAIQARRKIDNGAFHRAIRKYGAKVFKYRVLLRCGTCEIALQEEIRLIALLNPEYNSTKGGDGQLGRRVTQKMREAAYKVSQANIGRKHPPRTKEMRERLSVVGKTEKSRLTFAKYRSLGPASSARKVICLEDNKVFDSASAAARNYHTCRSAIVGVCLGKKYRKTAKGRHFIYLEKTIEQVA